MPRARVIHIVYVLLIFIFYARGTVLKAKEYICKDPDTGMLHAVNSTWRSTSFCGNYTCKLKKIDGSRTSKITVNITGPQFKSPPSNEILINNDENYKLNEFSLTKLLPDISRDSDRLLNGAEIQKITELLHTVKKSDLQAVLELYNVAQEIYKGMKIGMIDNNVYSKPDTDSFSGEAKSSEPNFEDSSKSSNNKVSYWYEPINGFRKNNDLKSEGSQHKITTTYPVRNLHEPPFFYASRHTDDPTYFSGTLLTNEDFGRLGYHPRPSYQTVPPYYPQRSVYAPSGSNTQPRCNPCPMPYHYQTPIPAGPAAAAGAAYAGVQTPTEMPRFYQYPNQYNYTHNYNNYNNFYKGNPWAYYDYYRKLPYQHQVQKIPALFNAESIPSEYQKARDESFGNTKKEEDDKSWKTDSLSDVVINDIRANIAERGKLLNIPLKKRIKLERAAKLIKLDQFNKRVTRAAIPVAEDTKTKETPEKVQANEDIKKNSNETTEMEVYLEKLTCEPSSELGYFRIGNMSHPFPDCCPHKIDDKQR